MPIPTKVFTSEVIGSDGARARLRHEQNGYGLMFGGAGGFLTPNMADVRNPILVHLHGAGGEERYQVNLLEEEPEMPSAREMLHIVAKDPIAQARFFILSMRLFCEHVLGTGPFDSLLRHNSWLDGAAFPDGFAASGLGGAFGMLAALHGPIEEQARLSIHPHILLWFIHQQSEQWLRSILRGETEDARQRLRVWQEKVLATVQSMQLDSAAVLPLLLTEEPETLSAPQNTPFSVQHQADCRFDGKIEGDLRDTKKTRPLLDVEPLFEDHHIRRKRESMPMISPEFDRYVIPQTGAHLCKLPHYRLLKPLTEDDLETAEGVKAEAAAYREAYSQDYRLSIAVGQMHEHKDTCFKYVMDKAIRFAKHCRFHFNHFVILCVIMTGGDSKASKSKRDVTFARTGKELILPRAPGDPLPELCPLDADGKQQALKPTTSLGPTVDTDDHHGKQGLVKPIRWNPLEGSSSGPCQVGLRGNVDYQSMLRTFTDGFNPDVPDRLRGAPNTEKDNELAEAAELEQFEDRLPARVQKEVAARKKRGQDHKQPEDIEEELREAHIMRADDRKATGPTKRFATWVRSLVVDTMKNSIQAMFYACDYSTKPNMTCAHTLVALRGGVQRLEEELKQQAEEAQNQEITAITQTLPFNNSKRQLTKQQDEARRRLIRLATAANQAIVKGSCLMAMQMLTGREVLRTHYPWQLMMKHAMWMAFQHRRELQGYDEQDPQEDVALVLVEGEVAPEEEEEEEHDDADTGSGSGADSTGEETTAKPATHSDGTAENAGNEVTAPSIEDTLREEDKVDMHQTELR